MREENRRIFWTNLREMCRRPELIPLRTQPRHRGSTTFQHSVNVAVYSFYFAEKWHWTVDIPSLVRGAMLHDFYLGDPAYSGFGGAVNHPKLALKRAQRYFDLNAVERDVILSHMWPTPGSPMPRTREALLVNLADKHCASLELRRGCGRLPIPEQIRPVER